MPEEGRTGRGFLAAGRGYGKGEMGTSESGREDRNDGAKGHGRRIVRERVVIIR